MRRTIASSPRARRCVLHCCGLWESLKESFRPEKIARKPLTAENADMLSPVALAPTALAPVAPVSLASPGQIGLLAQKSGLVIHRAYLVANPDPKLATPHLPLPIDVTTALREGADTIEIFTKFVPANPNRSNYDMVIEWSWVAKSGARGPWKTVLRENASARDNYTEGNFWPPAVAPLSSRGGLPPMVTAILQVGKKHEISSAILPWLGPEGRWRPPTWHIYESVCALLWRDGIRDPLPSTVNVFWIGGDGTRGIFWLGSVGTRPLALVAPENLQARSQPKKASVSFVASVLTAHDQAHSVLQHVGSSDGGRAPAVPAGKTVGNRKTPGSSKGKEEESRKQRHNSESSDSDE